MDKFQEVIITIITAFLAGVGWIIRRLFNRIDEAHERIDRLDSLVDREYLEHQLNILVNKKREIKNY